MSYFTPTFSYFRLPRAILIQKYTLDAIFCDKLGWIEVRHHRSIEEPPFVCSKSLGFFR